MNFVSASQPASGGATHAQSGPKPVALHFRLPPPCFPSFSARAREAKTAPKGRFYPLKILKDFGAGEGIRTLDPNLGKTPERSTPWYPAPRHVLIIIYKSVT
jgi:hypothetical protein